MTNSFDISLLTEQQKRDYLECGIVPGPVHNNFDVCSSDCYVATFEHYDRHKEPSKQIAVVDVYMAKDSFGDVILWREDSEWEGSYGAQRIPAFLGCVHFDFYKHMLRVLQYKGEFVWQRNKEKPDHEGNQVTLSTHEETTTTVHDMGTSD